MGVLSFFSLRGHFCFFILSSEFYSFCEIRDANLATHIPTFSNLKLATRNLKLEYNMFSFLFKIILKDILLKNISIYYILGYNK